MQLDHLLFTVISMPVNDEASMRLSGRDDSVLRENVL